MSQYEKQANDFLAKTETRFSTKFLTYGPYFEDDKESRNVFWVTFSRGKTRFRLKFGTSIVDSQTKKKEAQNTFHVVFDGQASELKHPTAYDVLVCLTKYDPGAFENFCSEYGYDTDSRKAFKTYKAVVREWKNVERLWSAEEIEELQEIN